MSRKAVRLTSSAVSQPFTWTHVDQPLPSPPPRPKPAPTDPAPRIEPLPEAAPVRSVDAPAAIEREAFAKGFAQGERSGAEAAARQGEAMLRRLADTINEVAALRTDLLHRAERELVRLALAIAERVIRREISLDRELLVAMARVAIDRLGERVSATIHLNPADHAALSATDASPETGPVTIVADPLIGRGGCLVRSDFGLIDLGLDAQMAEMSRALLGPDGSGERVADGDATVGLPDD